MHDTIAFSESLDLAGVEGSIAAVPDQHIKTEGDDITVGPNNNVIGVLACVGTTGTRAKLVAPSLRRVNPYDVSPLVLALFPSDLPFVNMHPGNPIPLEVNEALNAVFTADPLAAEQETCVVFTAPGAVNPVTGKIFPVRFSVTVALLQGSYAFAAINLVDDLPNGNYAVVGADLVAATAVAFRFVPVGAAHRPGGPVRQTVANNPTPIFRFGGLGEWFTFTTVQLPGIEILSSAAAGSTTYYGTMDILAK